MRTITCGDCGRPISDSQRTCPYCGYPVNMSINIMLQSRQAQQAGNTGRSSEKGSKHIRTPKHSTSRSYNNEIFSSSASAYNQDRYFSANSGSRSASRRKKQKTKQFWSAAAVTLIILLIVLLIILSVKKCAENSNSTASPVTDANGYTYYSNKRDDGKLYKLDENDEDAVPEKLSEFSPGEILLHGDWIYYVNNDKHQSIYRITTDGLDEMQITDSSARNMFIENGWLVFEDINDSYELYKIPIDDISVSGTQVPIKDDGSIPNDTSSVGVQNTSSGGEELSQDENTISTTPKDMVVDNSELPWNLVLANSNNKLDESYDDSITLGFTESGKKVDKRITSKLSEMLSEMREQMNRCDITPTSSYRSIKTQKSYFDRAVQKQLDAGLSQEEAEIKAAENVARPGASDHNTGLAVEFNDGLSYFDNSREYNWLQENAHLYGFVERYPVDKEDITGYSWESYHFRYVGIDAAKVMHDENLCLEEYIFEYYSDCIK